MKTKKSEGPQGHRIFDFLISFDFAIGFTKHLLILLV